MPVTLGWTVKTTGLLANSIWLNPCSISPERKGRAVLASRMRPARTDLIPPVEPMLSGISILPWVRFFSSAVASERNNSWLSPVPPTTMVSPAKPLMTRSLYARNNGGMT